MKNRKSIKVSEYFKIINPKYSIMRIIPDTSIRNYNSESIATVICNMYSLPIERIKRERFQFTYKLPYKTAFFIDIYTNQVNFYIITPEEFEKLVQEKCSNTWPKATIEKITSIPMFSDDALKYEMTYRKEDALSLKVDRKQNQPLASMLNVLDIMEQDDRVGIYYNFMPTNQLTWRNKHRDTLEKVKKNIPIDKNKLNISYIIKILIDELVKVFITFFDEIGNFIGEGANITDNVKTELSITGLNAYEKLSNTTLRKGDKNILDTQLIVLSQSKELKRKMNNAISVCEAFKSVSEDNSLNYKPIKRNVYYTEYKVKGAAVNKMSTDEAASTCIQIPGRTLLEQHDNIEKIDALEVSVPEELRTGYIRLGTVIYKGQQQEAYMRDEKHIGNLGLVVMGPQGSGKTTFLANYVKDAHSRGEAVIVPDFIKNCELSDEIEKVIPKNDLTVINLAEPNDLQGFGYNEIEFKENMSEFELLEVANMQAQQTLSLVDAINAEGSELTGRMRRYLSAAANVVYTNKGSNLRDVINCLQDYEKRALYIKAIPNNLRNYLQDEITALKEIDDIKEFKDKETKEVRIEVVGTKDSKIEYILDRINLLKEDTKLKYMFNKSLENNIDFVKEIENGKVILIKMPESKFPLKYVKNILVTYFMTKIWLSSQIRGSLHESPKRCHVIIDEIFQAPTSEKILRDVLPQCRKFGSKFIISCHYLSQIDKIAEALKASGASYMLLQGTDKKNYNELKEELEPYSIEDLLNLKRYRSLNLIKYEKGYAKFITKLPQPIK